MRRLFRHAFCSVLPAFFTHWSGANLIKCLNDYTVLSIGLEVCNLQMVLLYIFLGEINSLKHIWFVRRLSISNVVAKNLTIPVLARRRFPCYLMEFTFIARYIYFKNYNAIVLFVTLSVC